MTVELTPHEERVLIAMCENPKATMDEIAKQLDLKPTSAKDAAKNCRRKLKVNNRKDLMRKYRKINDVKPDPAIALKKAQDLIEKLNLALNKEAEKNQLLTEAVNEKNKELIRLDGKLSDRQEKIEKRQKYILKLETDVRSLRSREKKQDQKIDELNQLVDQLQKENDNHDQEIENELITRPTHCTLCKEALQETFK